ncbi:MAG TPA: DNA recombination protein RmuC [Bacteroidales bacterium]|nr:DNA recombination protein RmuC [Bacteroidales bacterium]
MDIVLFVAGLITGGFAAWLIFRMIQKEKLSAVAEKSHFLEEMLAGERQKSAEKDAQLLDLQAKYSSAETDLRNLQEQLTRQKSELEEVQKRLSVEFENLANRILEEKTKTFTEQNRTQLEGLLNPLSEKIREFRDQVEKAYGTEREQRFHLGKEIERLVQMNQQLSDEARSLTRALKGDTKTQGTWGEFILEKLLENSGLTRNREYTVQERMADEQGTTLIPDVIVRYPGGRNVVIDSKVSLVAYEKYVAADDEDSRQQSIREHLDSVKKHILELSRKDYQSLYQLNSLDFVMMFMPVEPGYYLALQQDPDLWQYAYQRKVLLMSPTNLLAALKLIESMWRIEYQNRNAQEIARQSSDLLDKFSGFLEDLKDIGKKIDDAHHAWEESMKKLATGKGSLLNRALKIQQLGARPKKEIPKEIAGYSLPENEENEPS